jgi:peptide/nickel transport system substrate-binding protein
LVTHVLKIAQPSVSFEDPHDCTDAGDVLSIFTAVFDTLIKRQGAHFVPHLAKSWNVSSQGRVWTFTLRPDVMFHDGVVVDASAVCANLRRLSQPDKGYALGSPGVWHQYLGDADFRVISHLVFEIVLQDPLSDLLDILVQAFILSPACFDADLHGRTVGSGAYILEDINEMRIKARANAAHFNAPVPYDIVEWQACPDAKLRWDKLVRSDVQIANRLPNGLQLPDITQVKYAAPVAIIYVFNITNGPLISSDLRRALNLAVDRPALINDVVDGGAIPLTGFISPAHFGSGEDKDTTFDLDQARDLLAKSDYPNGLNLIVSCPTRLPDEAEALTASLAAQLVRIGITLDVRTYDDREAYAHMVRKKQIGDMAVFDSSPLSTFRVIYEKLDARVAGAWWQGYENLKVHGFLDKARKTPDDTARAQIYLEAYKEISRDPPWLFLYNPIRRLGLRGHHPNFAMPSDGVLDVTRIPRLT